MVAKVDVQLTTNLGMFFGKIDNLEAGLKVKEGLEKNFVNLYSELKNQPNKNNLAISGPSLPRPK